MDDAFLQRLRRFHTEYFPSYAEEFRALVNDGQHPSTLFIGCSDSRLVPYLLTGARPGELFIVRNVGALVPPCDGDVDVPQDPRPAGAGPRLAGMHGTAAAIEFAVLNLRVRDIVVCGHSHCGAMRALYEGVPEEARHLHAWLDLAREAALPVQQTPEALRRTEQRAVVLQLERLMGYPMVRRRVEQGQLFLHGWHYVIEEGEVHVFDVESGRFLPASSSPHSGTGPFKGMEQPIFNEIDATHWQWMHGAGEPPACGCAAQAAGGSVAPSGRLAPWQARRLLEAPHRLAFFSAALVLGLGSLWWAGAVLTLQLGPAWRWALPPSLAHALLLGYGVLPLFYAGFLFTAGPRWLGQPPLHARRLLGAVLCCLAGWALFGVGTHGQLRVAAAGLGLAAAGLGWLGWLFIRMVWASAEEDQLDARLMATAWVAGTLVLAGAAGALAWNDLARVRALVHGGLWACHALVFVTALNRLAPFFSAGASPWLKALPRRSLLWGLTVVLGAQTVLAAAEPAGWRLPPALLAWQAGGEALVALLLLGLALQWGRRHSLRPRLVAMLHLGFVWLGLAFALGAVSHLLMALTDAAVSLGLAPLHALTMGFFGSLMIAMVTRVSCAQGGRALVADDFVWRLFWLLQSAVLARVVAALLPGAAPAAMVLAALAWAACFVAWALRYGRWYGEPRPDGRPG